MKLNGTQYKLLQESETAQLWQASSLGGAPFFEVKMRRVTRFKCRRVNWTDHGINSALQKLNDLLPVAVGKVAEIEKGCLKTTAF